MRWDWSAAWSWLKYLRYAEEIGVVRRWNETTAWIRVNEGSRREDLEKVGEVIGGNCLKEGEEGVTPG